MSKKRKGKTKQTKSGSSAHVAIDRAFIINTIDGNNTSYLILSKLEENPIWPDTAIGLT